MGALERELRAEVKGEVRFDQKARALYATDASPYRLAPIGVVIPLDEDDVRAAVRVAASHGAPSCRAAAAPAWLARRWARPWS